MTMRPDRCALRLLAGLLLASSFASLPAKAEAEAEAEAVAAAEQGEIVVTAQRRSERVQDVPVSITTIGSQFVDRARLDDVKDLVNFTPGFSGNSEDSYIDSIAVRGIVSNDYGVGGDPSIGFFKDGVYQGRTGAAVTSLYDIDHAEALRGPQGFLFGRNAISGAMSVTTNKPVLGSVAGKVAVSLGSHARKEGEFALNLPLATDTAVRLAGYATDYNGWVDNAFTLSRNDRLMGGNKQALRLSFRHQTDGADLTIRAEHERRRLDGTPYRASNEDREVLDQIGEALGEDVVIRGGKRDVDTDLTHPKDKGDVTSLTAQVDVPTGIGTFTSLSAYRRARFYYLEDYDGTPLRLGNYSQRQRSHYLSQDLRLVSPNNRALTWSAGLSGYYEKVRARFTNEADESSVCLAGYEYGSCEEMTQDLYGKAYVPASDNLLIDINDAASRNLGLSAFADVNLRIVPKLTAGAGLRYTWDRKRFSLDVLPTTSTLGNVWTFTYFTDGPVTAGKSWTGLTPRLYARYEASALFTVYASLTRGYKAGGFGSFTVRAPTAIEDFSLVPAGTTPDPFNPESVWSKELGVKGTAFERRLQFDVAFFHYVYRDLQSNYFNPATRTTEVINVGKVHGMGLEGSLSAKVTSWLDLAANGAWTRTRKTGDRDCDRHDCGGLPNPTWATSGSATFHRQVGAGEAWLQTDWMYEGHRRESFDWRGLTRRSAYTQVNASLGYTADAGWEVAAYVQNLTDKTYYLGAENNGELTPSNVWGVAEPRNYGLRGRWQF
ncbi:TonB-dependent receptor [Sphingomonas sp. ID0503]|uniref:TonB-dependent receptor n=1 Tax=Sphingomonas sp. ID0503 TaxID=3399691 RepID=UPI003AFA1E76